MKLSRLGLLCCSLLYVACDAGSPRGATHVSPPDRTPGSVGDPGSAGGFANAPPGTGQPFPEQLPTDERLPVIATKAPPPISGGTLLISRDGFTAVAADPDRDRVSFVDLRNGQVLGHVALEPGDEPGRVVEDAGGRIHVALRGSGAVAALDLAGRSLIERRSVCAAPRGIAYDASADLLHVACASGQLVSLPAAGGDTLRSVQLGADLRDVVVQGGRILVSQFRAASLLEVDAEGEVMGEYQPTSVRQTVALGADAFSGVLRPRTFAPALARRTIAMSDGRALMLHEREMSDEVDIGDPHESGDANTPAPPEVGGGYGSGGSCQSIVQTAVSVVDADGNVMQSSSLAGAVLPIDVAISANGTWIAVANAGTRDPLAPGRFGPLGRMAPPPSPGSFSGELPPIQAQIDPLEAGGSISLINTGEPTFHETAELGEACVFESTPVPGQPTAVAFTPDGTLVIQSREPAGLVLSSASGLRVIELGGESRLDTGHELFHRDAGGGIACASCHGEGGDDGHVWQFSGLGARRTQSVNIGLRDTAPFHWSGDMRDLPTLMTEVFVSRMGGVPQSDDRIEAFSGWLFEQKPIAAMRAAHEPAVVRGKALFESKEAGCAGCHNGEKLTNNASVDVGTGGVFQVPSLLGVAYRAPFIHTGCAATLRDRFDPACGGTEHGDVSHLGDAEIDDLVAYLESL